LQQYSPSNRSIGAQRAAQKQEHKITNKYPLIQRVDLRSRERDTLLGFRRVTRSEIGHRVCGPEQRQVEKIPRVTPLNDFSYYCNITRDTFPFDIFLSNKLIYQ